MRFAEEENHPGELTGSNRNEGSREEAILMSEDDAEEADVRSRIAREKIEVLSPFSSPLFFLPLDKTTICRRHSPEYRLMAHESMNEKLRVENDDSSAFGFRHIFAVPSALNPAGFSMNYSCCPTDRVFLPASSDPTLRTADFRPSPPGKSVSSKRSRGFDEEPTRVKSNWYREIPSVFIQNIPLICEILPVNFSALFFCLRIF